MLLSQFIMVGGLILGYIGIIGFMAFVGYIAIELMIMKARGVKIVRRKRH